MYLIWIRTSDFNYLFNGIQLLTVGAFWITLLVICFKNISGNEKPKAFRYVLYSLVPIIVLTATLTVVSIMFPGQDTNSIWNQFAFIAAPTIFWYLPYGLIYQLIGGETSIFIWSGGRPRRPARRFKGALDDVMIFERVLSDAEVAQLASESPVEPLDVRVGALGTLDLQGRDGAVSASGNGLVVNGTLAVKSLLAPGDDAGSLPGAVLDVQTLTLGTNVVYTCTLGAPPE